MRVLVLLCLGYLALCCGACGGKPDPLQGQTAGYVDSVIASYMELSLPPVSNYIGYHAGLGERFVKLEIDPRYLNELYSKNAQCGKTRRVPGYVASEVSGVPSTTLEWWDFGTVLNPTILDCELRNGRGRVAIIVDTSDPKTIIVYIYCYST